MAKKWIVNVKIEHICLNGFWKEKIWKVGTDIIEIENNRIF